MIGRVVGLCPVVVKDVVVVGLAVVTVVVITSATCMDTDNAMVTAKMIQKSTSRNKSRNKSINDIVFFF